jgi:hypothetical protein
MKIGVSNVLFADGKQISGGYMITLGDNKVALTWSQAEFLVEVLKQKMNPSETGVPDIWPVEVE